MFGLFKNKQASRSRDVLLRPRACAVDEGTPNNTFHDVKTTPEKSKSNRSVTTIIHNIMSGKRRRQNKHRNKQKNKDQNIATRLDKSVIDSRAIVKNNTQNERIYESVPELYAPAISENESPADFVKDIILQNYTGRLRCKPGVDARMQQNNKKYAEKLLSEIARAIDCDIDNQMGSSDSKQIRGDEMNYVVTDPNEDATIKRERKHSVDSSIDVLKHGLQSELNRLMKEEKTEAKKYEIPSFGPKIEEIDNSDDNSDGCDVPTIFYEDCDDENDQYAESNIVDKTCDKVEVIQSETTIADTLDTTQKILDKEGTPELKKKSNLKPPKQDSDPISDDEKSTESGKKRVTFRKRVLFDDGDEQTDESDAYTSDDDTDSDIPDNDELLGGFVVGRSDDYCEGVIITEIEEPEFFEATELNSDSGYVELNADVVEDDSDVSVDSEATDESESNNSDSESDSEELDIVEPTHDEKSLVNQEDKFQSQVAQLTELANSRNSEAERIREQIQKYRKDIESKDSELERVKLELEAAYKESELVRQRSKSLEDEVTAARQLSTTLAEKLHHYDASREDNLQKDLEAAVSKCSQLEYKIQQLVEDKTRLEIEKKVEEQKAAEAIASAEASTAKWRAAHESARSEAASRAERLLSDCEWKMRELEKRARDAEKNNSELKTELEKLKASELSASHLAELQQLRGLITEQQHSVVALTHQIHRMEENEESLKHEIQELRSMLEHERELNKQKDLKHREEVSAIRYVHTQTLEEVRTEHQRAHAAARVSMERSHADRTRHAITTLRAEHEKYERNAERKLLEANTKIESLKEKLSMKEQEMRNQLEETRSKTDWELLQLRHMLDRSDIQYANSIDKLKEKHEREKDQLIEEWSRKLMDCQQEYESTLGETRSLLESTRSRLIQERKEQINHLKDQHRMEMEKQWNVFCRDKEACLERMKLECMQEGNEEREKIERELIREIQELKAELAEKTGNFVEYVGRAAAVKRTLEVTEQELSEALEREKALRMQKSEDATKMKQIEQASKNEIDHLTRKCACLRKLFDDIRAKLQQRESNAEEESRAYQKEIQRLKAEVTRLTRLLMENSGMTTAKQLKQSHESFFLNADGQQNAIRRKGGTEIKKRNMSDTKFVIPDIIRPKYEIDGTRRRANSVDLPAVQVPERINQFESRSSLKRMNNS